MRGWAWGLGGMLVAAGLAGPAAAREQGVVKRTQDMLTEHPLTLQVGGGVANFTEDGTKTVTGTGGMWNVRGIFGAERLISGELAYVGSAQPVDAPNINHATVVQTGFEAMARIGLRRPVGTWYVNPYGGIGVGWSIYSLAGISGSRGALGQNDNTFVIPLALGVTTGYRHLNFDLRFSYRPQWGDEMFQAFETDSLSGGLNSLGLSAAVGWTF